MLKIECQGCGEWVSLPFDIELKETACPKCARAIPLKDVYVSAGPYTIHRDVLLKNMHRYKKLLAEAEREFEELDAREPGKGKDVTSKSIRLFISHMKEMLSGCRGSTRYALSDEITAKLRISDRTVNGKVINISVSGLCLDASGSPAFDLADELQITISCGTDKSIPVTGRVAWSAKGVLGIRFTNVAAGSRKAIESCISEKSILLSQRK